MNINQTVPYRRKRDGRTNYKKRLIYLKSGSHRLVVRKTNTQIILQITEYLPDGDKIICGATSNMLSKYGWKYSYNNLPACYLAGLLIAKKAKEHKVTSAIVDFGLQSNVAGSRLYAAIKGAIDGGLNIPADESAFPKEDRLKGKHISEYYSNSSASQFSKYKTEKTELTKIESDVDSVKKKILSK
jgi:large subunit ribosomal protein L18